MVLGCSSLGEKNSVKTCNKQITSPHAFIHFFDDFPLTKAHYQSSFRSNQFHPQIPPPRGVAFKVRARSPKTIGPRPRTTSKSIPMAGNGVKISEKTWGAIPTHRCPSCWSARSRDPQVIWRNQVSWGLRTRKHT